jgi:TRAP-type C4-dicarboxylate transport system permease small subunit
MSSERRGVSAGLSQAARWFAGAGLIVMTAIIAWQVFARYVLNASPAWGEQAALLLMIWYVMLAAAAGVREQFHIRIGVFVETLPARLQRPAIVFAHAVVCAFGVALVFWGVELTLATWEHVIPTLALPRGVAYLPMPLAGLLIAGFSAEHIVAVLRRAEVPETWN